MMTLKIADVVRLRSGGPAMSVLAVHDSGNVDCVWFNRDGGQFMPAYATFKDAVLERGAAAADPETTQGPSGLTGLQKALVGAYPAAG